MISIVICTHNRADSLVRVLESISEMRGSGDAASEVIVVDNASTDRTREVVENFGSRIEGLSVQYAYEGTPGLSHARNAGIARASGDVIAFLDDDVSVREDWLEALRSAFRRHEPSCVGGRALLRTEVDRPSWWNDSYEGKVGHFDRGDREIVSLSPDDGLIGIGANLAFHRGVFERHGHFRGELGRKGGQLSTGEEVDVVNRLRRAGEKAVYAPDVVVYHHPDPSRFTKAYLRRWYTGFGEWEYLRESTRWDESVRILGVPRWKYRSAAGDLLGLLGSLLSGRARTATLRELRLRSFLSYFRAARRDERD